MRRFLLIVALVAGSLITSAQQDSFKQIQKNKAGTQQAGFKYRVINGRATGPTAGISRSSAPKQLNFKADLTPDKPIVIRKNSTPIYIERKVKLLSSLAGVAPAERFFRFMEESKTFTGIPNPREAFNVSNIIHDDLGVTHIRSVQQFRGIEIYGSETTLHLDKNTERLTGSLWAVKEKTRTIPEISFEQSILIANRDCGKSTVLRELSVEERRFLHYDGPAYNLVLFKTDEGDFRLTWEITIRPNFIEEWKYFIDAADGNILRKYNNTNYDGPLTGNAPDLNNTTRTVDVFLENGMYYLYNAAETMYNPTIDEGLIITLDANNTSTTALKYTMVSCDDNAWTGHKAAISAHYNAKQAYAYFKTKFNRNSINGKGGNIVSFVNVAEDDGSSMENAFWNGYAVFYGNGGNAFKSLAGALDVAAHELGHGVVSNTANLQYFGQSGAINESFADIFGSMVDRDDWLIGEDVVKTAFFPSGALRNMADPHNGGNSNNHFWQPSHLSEIYLGNDDNGGVHINSGIGNHAYYLFATAVSKEKAELVFYRALEHYLTKTSQFIDLRIAVIESAKDLYGASSAEVTKAAEAFDAIGIYADVPEETPDDYEANPGQQNLLIYNTDDNYPFTLYTSPIPATNYSPLSAKEMKSRVSVTDDGSVGAYVGSDDIIYAISLDSQNPAESELSGAYFDNVAVSKDGNRIAAISTEIDTAIYVYDYISEEWGKFTLYNPTTGDGSMVSGGVLFADAIEFDHSGEYLIYDAYNELNSDVSEDISYWDVGFIKVWDNTTNTFGDGSIIKLFTSLPKNVSIGNAVFSKNSPNIIAFDYFYADEYEVDFRIYGANLETGDMDVITANTDLGYPSFSNNDDRIAFTYTQDMGFYNREDIYTIGLDDNKISPEGSAQFEIDYAKWPVYYAIGDRNLELKPVANFTADYKTGSAPLVVQFVDLSMNTPTSWTWNFQGGNPSVSHLQNPLVTFNAAGTYRVSLTASNESGDNTITRNGYIVVSGTTGTGNPVEAIISFYPNPVKDVLTITGPDNAKVVIYNLEGRVLKSLADETLIDVSDLKPGLYILEIVTGKDSHRFKLLKE